MNINSFTKKDSQVLKGIAILAMLWHHTFLAGRFEDFPVSVWPLSEVSIASIAFFFKFCVSIFAFISGYGLYRSFLNLSEHKPHTIVKWCRDRYVKTFKGYWIIIILLWIAGSTVGSLTKTTYFGDTSLPGIISGIFYMILDFLGLSKFFSAPSLIGTWWYMTAALVFIVLVPFLFKLLNSFGCFMTVALLFIIPRIGTGYPGSIAFFSFVPGFCVGMSFSKLDVFSAIDKYVAKAFNRTIIIMGGYC